MLVYPEKFIPDAVGPEVCGVITDNAKRIFNSPHLYNRFFIHPSVRGVQNPLVKTLVIGVSEANSKTIADLGQQISSEFSIENMLLDRTLAEPTRVAANGLINALAYLRETVGGNLGAFVHLYTPPTRFALHTDSIKTTIVGVEGEGEWRAGDTPETMRCYPSTSGSALVIPAGLQHDFRTTTDQERMSITLLDRP